MTIPISVTGTFDLRAQGLDVTQGIQPAVGVLLPSGGSSGGAYNGVDLVAGKTTVVRFYADAHGAPQGISGVAAVLHGFRNGVELPGSPIYPAYGPATLPDTGEADPAPVFQSELESDNNAFTFVLPASWTSGTIQLVGDVLNPVPSFSGPQVLECQSPACLANDSFTLNDVIFNPTIDVTINTIALSVNGTAPVPAAQAFTDAKAVTPLSDQGFVILPYAATLDVSSAINSNQSAAAKGGAAEGVVAQWDQNNGNPNFSTIGITPTGTNGLTVGRDSEADYAPNASTGNDRPLTSVAHEMFHQFGLAHASNECGGGQDGDSDDGTQTGTVWYPVLSTDTDSTPQDGVGQLDGIGLDTTSQPFKILASGLNGVSQYYDFMSYCSATIGFGDAGNWVSPQNWELVFNRFKAPSGGAQDAGAASAATPAVGPLASVAAVDPARLRVIAFVSKGAGVQITSVGPQVGPPVARASSATVSSFTLTAQASGGRTIASVPMTVTPGHIDHVGGLDEARCRGARGWSAEHQDLRRDDCRDPQAPCSRTACSDPRAAARGARGEAWDGPRALDSDQPRASRADGVGRLFARRRAHVADDLHRRQPWSRDAAELLLHRLARCAGARASERRLQRSHRGFSALHRVRGPAGSVDPEPAPGHARERRRDPAAHRAGIRPAVADALGPEPAVVRRAVPARHRRRDQRRATAAWR